MTYEEAVGYLETFINYEKKASFNYKGAFKLERMKKLLANLGNPQERLKIIHVAGTKGKGSTSCFIAHILKEEGQRVGLYTSPHLVEFRERIRILDANNTADAHTPFPGMILKNEFAQLMAQLRPQIDFFRRSFQHYGAPTFFEVLTALALKYFSEKGVTFAVLETGLGGRLDATNAADSLVSVITPISYDHEHILGSTLTEIAFEKSCIIKGSNRKTPDGVSVTITAPQERCVSAVISRRARKEEAVLFECGKDFTFKKLHADLACQDFFYRGLNNEPYFFKIRMLGNHQIVNASLAVAACESLSLHGIRIKDGMARGLFDAYWPGRLEVVSTKPFLILDGAHNRDSASRLAHFLGKEFKKMRKWMVLGISQDKDIKGLLQELEGVADKIILTRANNPRAADPRQMLRPHLRREPHAVTESVEEALTLIQRDIAPDDVVVVTGSLFVIGEAKAIWQG